MQIEARVVLTGHREKGVHDEDSLALEQVATEAVQFTALEVG